MDLDRLPRNPDPITEEGIRRAAVLIPVIDTAGRIQLLFTKRAEWLTRHPGQMSFPGGTREPTDADSFETALREAREEVGIRSNETNLVGRLSDIRTISGFAVTPIVAQVPDRAYEPDGGEIVEAVVLPLEEFLDPDNFERKWRPGPSGVKEPVEFFYVDGYTVWGATGRLVAQLLEQTTDWSLSEEPATR